MYSAEGDEVLEGMIIEEFLTRTASQLTYHGLCELSTTIQEEELCVFFRNNHFSTLYKHKGETLLYPLPGREWNSFREKIEFVPFLGQIDLLLPEQNNMGFFVRIKLAIPFRMRG